MEMKHSLNLSMRPTLIMTPRLQQALKLLQMPALELSAHIKEELLANPLLEMDEDAHRDSRVGCHVEKCSLGVEIMLTLFPKQECRSRVYGDANHGNS